MALLKYGSLVAAASGTVGGTVFAHNRGGAYARTWAKPHVVTSEAAEQAKAILSVTSRLWGALSDAERKAWATYCVEVPSINRLGDSRTLSGHQAFNQVNSRVLQCGVLPLDLPPSGGPPDPLLIDSFAVDISTTSASIAFSPSPAGADVYAWVWACVANSAGVGYVLNRMRLLKVSAAAVASPINIYADLLGRFGTLSAGQVVHVRLQACDGTTGLVSGYSATKAVVTD